jgi:uncharacterized protein DUF1566
VWEKEKSMKRIRFAIVLTMLGTAALPRPAGAQTVAVGGYYATPSWDQTLPAASRFIVLSNWNNEAVLDRETGLVWERSPNTAAPWANASGGCVGITVGGRRGWRLPTIQELMTLTSPAVLPAGHPFETIAGEYWSATGDVLSPGVAHRGVDFTTGVPFASLDSQIKQRWCVRGGSGTDAQ